MVMADDATNRKQVRFWVEEGDHPRVSDDVFEDWMLPQGPLISLPSNASVRGADSSLHEMDRHL